MIEPGPSVAPVLLHPAVAADATEPSVTPARARKIKRWARRVLVGLCAIAALWRRLPSIEDARKFVVNALMIAGAGFGLVIIAKAALTPSTIIDAISVPKELEERGYTSAVVAQQLIDEMAQIA